MESLICRFNFLLTDLGADGTWVDITPSSGSEPLDRVYPAMGYANDKIYIYSGDSYPTDENDLWSFDLDTETWTEHPTANVPDTREKVADWFIGDKIYLFGGNRPGSPGTLRTELYALDTSKLEASADTSFYTIGPSFDTGQMQIGDKLYFYSDSDLSTVSVFSPIKNEWETLSLASAPSAYTSMHLTHDGTSLYLVCGSVVPNLNIVWTVDLSDEAPTWIKVFDTSASGQFPELTFPTIGAMDGSLYFFGGMSQDLTTFIDEVWRYDTQNHLWTLITPTGTVPSVVWSSMEVLDNKIMIYGGYVSPGFASFSNDLWSYDPSIGTDGAITLLSAANPPVGTVQNSLTTDGEKLYLFGGIISGSTYSDKTYVYDPSVGAGGTWSEMVVSGDQPSGRINALFLSVFDRLFLMGGSIASSHPDNYSQIFVLRAE